MSRNVAELELEVTVKVKTLNGVYGGELYDKTLVNVEHKKALIGTTDSNKRKLIEQVEDVMDQTYREVTKGLHNSAFLSDGAKAKDDELNG